VDMTLDNFLMVALAAGVSRFALV